MEIHDQIQAVVSAPFLTARGRAVAEGMLRATFLCEVARAEHAFPLRRTAHVDGHVYQYVITRLETRGVQLVAHVTDARLDGAAIPMDSELILINTPIEPEPIPFMLRQYDACVIDAARPHLRADD